MSSNVIPQQGSTWHPAVNSGDALLFHLNSGSVLSGGVQFRDFFASGYWFVTSERCCHCGKAYTYVDLSYYYGNRRRSCMECLGFQDSPPLPPREMWIRETTPLQSGTPRFILADWCDENGRERDGEYLRLLEVRCLENQPQQLVSGNPSWFTSASGSI